MQLSNINSALDYRGARQARYMQRKKSQLSRITLQWCHTHREESGSTVLTHGQTSPSGIRVTRTEARLWNVTCGTSISLSHFQGRLILILNSSFPTPWFYICHWQILNHFCLTAPLRASFSLPCWNWITGEETREKKHKWRAGHFPQIPPLFRAPTNVPETTPRSSWSLINFVLRIIWIWNCKRQRPNSAAQFKESFLVLWPGYEEQAQLVCFGCKLW